MNNFERAEELNEQGNAYNEAGESDLALQAYEEALRLNPNAAKTLYNIGLIYKYRNDWGKSFDYATGLLRARPGPITALGLTEPTDQSRTTSARRPCA
jgi:tetratricopeptide (TPR) repeat protein